LNSPTLTELAEKARARRIVSVAPTDPDDAVVAVLGVDTDGIAVYAEIVTGHDKEQDRALLGKVLTTLGAQEPLLYLPRPLELALGGEANLSGHPVPLNEHSVVLTRAPVTGVQRIFKDTPIVPPHVWAPLQRKRIRYFRKSGDSHSTEPAP
jgi:hypothetical protein